MSSLSVAGARVDALCVSACGGGIALALLASVLEGPLWRSRLLVSWRASAAAAWPPAATIELPRTASALALCEASAPAAAAAPAAAITVLVGDDEGSIRSWRAAAAAAGSGGGGGGALMTLAELAPRGWHHSAVLSLAAAPAWLASLDSGGALALWPLAAAAPPPPLPPLQPQASRAAPSPGCRSALSCLALIVSAASPAEPPLALCGRRDGLALLLAAPPAPPAGAAGAAGEWAELARCRLAGAESGAVTSLAQCELPGEPPQLRLVLAGLEDGSLIAATLRLAAAPGGGGGGGALLGGLRALRRHALPVRALALLPPAAAGGAVLVASASEDTRVALSRALRPATGGGLLLEASAAQPAPRAHGDYAVCLAALPRDDSRGTPPLLLSGGWDGLVHETALRELDAGGGSGAASSSGSF